MVRAFDNWNSYLDNDGNLLHGKIRFCRKGTTDNVTIYNSDGTVALRNPEFTDMLGRTEYQVFVSADDDVSAYFYKYVGNGDMMGTESDDYDPARWAYQYSSDNIDPAKSVSIESDTAQGVATMSDLRAKDPSDVASVNGAKFLWLYGYYAAGDKAPVLYAWDASSRKNDDGGSVIRPSSVSGPGRWILASREYIFDVRHFGVFPQADKYSTDYSYTSQLSNCADYLTNEGLNAWFPEIFNSLGYYIFDGTNTFSITGDIYVGDGARFMCKSGTSGTAIQCNRLYKAAPYLFDSSVQTGTATLTADNINISWLGGQVTGNARVSWTIDDDGYPRVITGKKVIFETNGHPGIQLDNCQVESHKAITGSIVMQNMAVKTEWFSDNYSWSNLSLYSCTVRLEDCKDADTYILLKNKMGQVDYGDLGEQEVHSASFGADCIVENCSGTASFAGNAELRNVTLTATFGGTTPYVNAADSWLTVSGSPVFGTFMLNRGQLAGSQGVSVLNTFKCDNATLDNSVSVLGGTLLLDCCVINGAISHVGSPVQENVRNCIFNNSISIRGGSAGALVQAVWQDNVGFAANPIVIDRTNLDPDDSAHTYTYSGNTGTFVKGEGDFTIDGRTVTFGVIGSNNNTVGFLEFGQNLTSSQPHTDPDYYLGRFKLFTVGTENVSVRATFVPDATVDGGTPTVKQQTLLMGNTLGLDQVERAGSSDMVGFPRALTFAGGYLWSITRAMGYCTLLGGDQYLGGTHVKVLVEKS